MNKLNMRFWTYIKSLNETFLVATIVIVLVIPLSILFYISNTNNDTKEEPEYFHPVTEYSSGYSPLSKWDVGDSIIVYAKVTKISSSGDFRFFHTTQDGEKLDGDNWFWVVPGNLQDKANIDRIASMLSEDSQSVYEIRGIKGEDDCDYYESSQLVGTCTPSIYFTGILKLKVAISTTDVHGYTIEFTHSFIEDEPDVSYGSKIRILKDGKFVFEAEEMQDFGGFYSYEVGDWLRNADELKKRAVKDVTGDGILELFIEGYSGGSHCCFQNYVIQLSNPIAILLDLDTGDYGINFKDLNNDGVMEIETNEDVFAYWHTSFSASPMPPVVLSLRNGKYKADPTLMLKQPPTDTEIIKMASTIESWSGSAGPEVAWKYAIDLIYSGNIKSARKYVDLAWRENDNKEFGTKDNFWKELEEQTQTSPYYADLSAFLGI